MFKTAEEVKADRKNRLSGQAHQELDRAITRIRRTDHLDHDGASWHVHEDARQTIQDYAARAALNGKSAKLRDAENSKHELDKEQLSDLVDAATEWLEELRDAADTIRSNIDSADAENLQALLDALKSVETKSALKDLAD